MNAFTFGLHDAYPIAGELLEKACFAKFLSQLADARGKLQDTTCIDKVGEDGNLEFSGENGEFKVEVCKEFNGVIKWL